MLRVQSPDDGHQCMEGPYERGCGGVARGESGRVWALAEGMAVVGLGAGGRA